MRPRPFLLLIAGFVLVMLAAGEADAAPTANIDSISPSPVRLDEEVTFNGTGSDSDGTIVAYQWNSSIDGFLSDEENFSISNLSVGNHTISFRVQDNDGNWSDAASELLIVKPLELEEVCLNEHANLTLHIHVMLLILDNGTPLTIPTSTGIDTETCPGGMHAIHTHDTSGKLHIETPYVTPVYLGTFFNIWAQPFSAEQVMHMVADANHTLTMKVDGVAYDSWELTLLADQQVIVVEYQAAGENGTVSPPPVDDTSNPPANDTSEQTYDADDDTRLPATSLLTTLVAVATIALKRRRSD